MSDIGVYKITNNINGKVYVGQSCQIHQRWNNHIIASKNKNDKGYNYPLYEDFREFGVNNFTFEIIEEMEVYNLEELLKRESYWINTLNAEYNQAAEKNNNITYNKLTEEQVNEIKQILINDTSREVLNSDLALFYNVDKDTIRDINVGRTWYDENLEYPLRYSKFDNREKYISNCENACNVCGKTISKKSKFCVDCYKKIREQKSMINTHTNKHVEKEDLENLIYKYPFTQIGKMFNVSDNTIRKWCIKYDLPYKKKDIDNHINELNESVIK